MKERAERVKALWERRMVYTRLLNVFGEIENNRAYKSGKMGAYDEKNLDDRLCNVLIAARKVGLPWASLLELASDPSKPLPELMIQKLTQYSVISEFRYHMWAGNPQQDHALGYVLDINHHIAVYKDSRRFLRKRYYKIPDESVRKFLPEGFSLL